MAASVPLLQDERTFYVGEKEPNTKEYQELPVSVEAEDGVPTAPRLQPWSTGLFNCCCNEPDHCGTDCEICCLGFLAPCILHGGTRERLMQDTGETSNQCLLTTALIALFGLGGGYCIYKFCTFPTRETIRSRFGLKGDARCLVACGSSLCCSEAPPEEDISQGCNKACDCCVHICCHRLALCQEAREVRRRVLHPTDLARAEAAIAATKALAAPPQQVFQP